MPICKVGPHSHLYKYSAKSGARSLARSPTHAALSAADTRGTACSCRQCKCVRNALTFHLCRDSSCVTPSRAGRAPAWGPTYWRNSMTGLQTHTRHMGECLLSCRSDDCCSAQPREKKKKNISRVLNCLPFFIMNPQVPEEAGADLLGFPQPGRDERRGGAAVQLAAHAEAADAERRLRGENLETPPTPSPRWMLIDPALVFASTQPRL